MKILKEELTGAILTGGQARRMQPLAADQPSGQAPIDKGLLKLKGQPLVAWQHKLLQPQVSEIIINANQNLAQYYPYGRVVPDDVDLPQEQGPMIGLLSIIRHSHTPWVVVVPVDSPFLPGDFVAQLVRARAQQPDRWVFYSRADRDYPLCVLLHTRVADSLTEYVLSDGRRVMPWLRALSAVAVDFGAQAASYFTNINTPQDLADAEHLADRHLGGIDLVQPD